MRKSTHIKNEFYDELVQSAQAQVVYLSQRQNTSWNFELQRLIEKVFRGVKCQGEKNVLLGGAALDDDCYSDAVMQDLQKREERKDWSNLSSSMLLACDDALYFVGPEAFRFLMPAYMILSLKYSLSEHVVKWLGAMGLYTNSKGGGLEYSFKRFEGFSQEQKQAVQQWYSSQRQLLDSQGYYGPDICVPFLPWEYEEFTQQGNGLSIREFLQLTRL